MKILNRISAILLASVLAFSSTAMANPHRVMAPQAAVETNALVQSVQNQLAAEGYTLDDVDEQPVNYFIQPEAPYVWGNMVYTYSRPGARLQLPRQKVQVTVKLKYLKVGVAVPELSVHENEQLAE